MQNNKVRCTDKYFIFVKREQGDALNDLWNFLVVACSHTLKLVINKRNTQKALFVVNKVLLVGSG